MADLKESFSLYDENGEGFVNSSDCATLVRSSGLNPTEHELQVAIANVDSGSGKFSVSDVSSIIGSIKKADYDSEVKEAFKVFDKDGAGSIEIAELKHILSNLGERMSEDEVKNLLKEAGLEGKSTVSCTEFLKLMLA